MAFAASFRGFSNFKLTTGWLHGAGDAISAKAVEYRAFLGDNIFFHVHPNVNDGYHLPYFSHGVTDYTGGGDIGIGWHNQMFLVMYAFETKKLYFYDGRH
ncbi:MAG: hypothetical protein JO013_16410 [Alphaproteobacteria bacterium]|nr:hypothetical protein [Alphaproteobacteria bacterium]